MKLPFYKIHGAGNDILVFDSARLKMTEAQKGRFLLKMANRNLGIGADQILEVYSRDPLSIQVWNQDGSKAEMCANGTRAFLHLAHEEGWIPKGAKEVPIRVSGKDYAGRLLKNGFFEVALGVPKIQGMNTVRVKNEKIPFLEVSVGNPHAIIRMDSLAKSPWQPKKFQFLEWGPLIEYHPYFPHRTNVEFVREIKKSKDCWQVVSEVWERGAGPTLSCGSGAVAVAAAIRAQEKNCPQQFAIQTNDFTLNVAFRDDQAYLSGPAEVIAEGTYRG